MTDTYLHRRQVPAWVRPNINSRGVSAFRSTTPGYRR